MNRDAYWQSHSKHSSFALSTLYKQWGRPLPPDLQKAAQENEQHIPELFLADVQDARNGLSQTNTPVLSDPHSMQTIHYRGGSLVPRAARTGGLIVIMPSGAGKSRLLGRGICYTDLMQGVGTVVIDSVGATIDNCLDKVLYLSQDKQRAVVDRIRYCNMSGEQLDNGDLLITPWPMLAKRHQEESSYRVSQRIVDLIARTDRRLADASIQGLKRLTHLFTPVAIILQELQLPISYAEDLLTHPAQWLDVVSRLAQGNTTNSLTQAITALRDFSALPEKVREERSEPLRTRLGMLKFDDVARAMFATTRPPLIDWEHVAAEGLSVYIDLRAPEADATKELKLFWVWRALHHNWGSNTRSGSRIMNKPPLLVVACNFGAKPVWSSLRDFIRSRESAGHDLPPFSLVIDELAFFVLGKNLNAETISRDFRELIQVRKRNANIWLTLATQNQEDLPETLRTACLQIASQLYGSVHDADSAYALAKRWYTANPKKIKEQRMGYKEVPPTAAAIPQLRFQHVMDNYTEYAVPSEVKHTTFYTLDEQHYEQSRKFINQTKGHALFAQSRSEGHIPTELLPISINNFDRGPDGKLRYVNRQNVEEFRRRLMQRDGIPVSVSLAELERTAVPPAPVQALGGSDEQPSEENGRNRQQHPSPPRRDEQGAYQDQAPTPNGQNSHGGGNRFGQLSPDAFL